MVQLHEYESNRATAAMLSASRGHDTRKDEFLVQPHDTLTAHSAQEIPTKTCTRCGKTKPATAEFFPLAKRYAGGLSTWCRACFREYNRTHKRPNPEKRAEYNRKYLRAYFADPVNKEKKAEYDRAYREVNKEKINERIAKWHAKNPHKAKEYRIRLTPNRDARRAIKYRYLARKRNAQGSHSTADIKRQYEAQKGRCYYCQAKVGDNYHVDHVIPLSRGGSNGPENIVVACVSCNTSKRDKLPHEWVQGGRLL